MSDVRLAAVAHAQDAPKDLEDQFPGRWDPKRSIHRGLRPLVEATARALRGAGWWEPGHTAGGGLVVGVDWHGLEPGLRFGRSLERERPTLRPSDFLHSLPSTPATTLSLLFGLQEYQATLDLLPDSGPQLLAHGVDRLRLGRVQRVVVAALSVVGPTAEERLAPGAGTFALGVALCLERGEAPVTELEGPQIPPAYRGLAAPALLATVSGHQFRS